MFTSFKIQNLNMGITVYNKWEVWTFSLNEIPIFATFWDIFIWLSFSKVSDRQPDGETEQRQTDNWTEPDRWSHIECIWLTNTWATVEKCG